MFKSKFLSKVFTWKFAGFVLIYVLIKNGIQEYRNHENWEEKNPISSRNLKTLENNLNSEYPLTISPDFSITHVAISSTLPLILQYLL